MDDSLLQSPYTTLDIPEDASHAVIRKTFRKLVLSCHPDRVQDESIKEQKAEQFHQVVQAYKILSDDSRRQRYDERLNLQKLRARAPLPPLDSSTFSNQDRLRMNDPWSIVNYPDYFLQQQLSSGYQNLRPPPLRTDYPSIPDFVNRASSHGSSDSGYATKDSSVASISYQNCAIQNYPQSYVTSPQLSQQNAIHSYGNQRSHDTEAPRVAPISSSIHKERKLRTPSPESPTEYPCLHPGCGHVSSRAHDLKRHMIVHFPPAVEELLDCKYEWCGRTGARGFKREDHRMEHYRMVHMKESEYPEMSKRSSEQRSVRKEHEHRSSPTTSTIHSLVDWNVDTPSQIKETKRKSTAGEESVPLSGNIQHSRQPAEPVALLETLQQPKIYDSLPDSETVGSKVSASSSGLEALDANHTDSMDLTFTTADDVGSWETESNDVEELYFSSNFSSIDFCLGDEHVHKKPKFDIFEDLGTCAEPGHRHQTETVLDRNDMIDSSRCSTNHKLAVIEFQVLATLSASGTGQYRASLKMQWDVLGFMEDQFRDSDVPNTALGSVVIISGSSKHSQATSCKEYIAQNWPAHGLEILDALQDALDSPTNTSQSEIVARTDGKDVHSDGASSGHAELEIDVTLKMLVLKIESITPDIIVDIVQQLAWMGAALRTSKDGQVQYCEAKLQGVKRAEGLEPAHFYVSFDMNSPGKDDRSCWFPLFTNPVIAHGFPTAPRNHNEVGLEIPLDMMAALGGARHAADFEGGLVLKGYSALLVPIRRHEDSVQWHLIRARDEERISYQEASLQCPNRVLLKDLNHEALVTTRAFLGWWREAEINLGTGDADYESIDWSKAKEVGPLPRLTGGTLGVSKIISASVNFQLGAKDGSFHHFQDGPFQKTIDRAENLPVVLYDQRDRRAWLVPAILVILHIIQLQNHLKPFIVGGNKVKISPLDASRQAHAAREVIAKNKSQKLFDCESKDETEYCFRDAVLDIWSILDRLMEREATQQATPGLAMHATWQSTLYGWEFRAVADGDRHFKQKAQTLEKTAGRWYDLVKDVDAVVLFASGLGDIIKPKSDLGGLCREWRSLPKDKDYLAVCVPILEMFYAKAGHRQDHQYLTSAKLQWYRGSSLFEKCADVASDCGGCDRLQQLHRDSYKWIGYGKPPGKLEVNGCVAFGQAHRSLKRSKIFAMRKKAVHTLPNISIQDDEFAKTISGTDDCILPASSAPLSPEPRGIDGHEIQKMRRPPSPPNVNDALLQEEATVIRKNRQMTHAQTPRFDIPENSERGKDPVPEFSPSGNISYRAPVETQTRYTFNRKSLRICPHYVRFRR